MGTVTIVQELVKLHCGYNMVSFLWPLGSDEVTVSASEGIHQEPTVYSVQEGHDLFCALMDAGAY